MRYTRLKALVLNLILSYEPIHTTPVKFENGVYTLNTNQVFSVHTKPEKFKNPTTNGHFWICVTFEDISGREIMIIVKSAFSKTPSFSKCFPSILAVIFKFIQFEERFRKAPFFVTNYWDGRPNRRNKA